MYKRKYKYNKTYAGKYTKREFASRVMGVKLCVAMFLSMGVLQAMAMTNEFQIIGEEPPSVSKPLVEEIEPPEIKEKVEIIDSYGVYEHIVKVTSTKGLDTELYLDIIRCESQFDPDARNSISSARGISQFTKGTWQDGVRWRGLDWTLNDRYDYKKSLDMMIYFIEERGEISRWECLKLI